MNKVLKSKTPLGISTSPPYKGITLPLSVPLISLISKKIFAGSKFSPAANGQIGLGGQGSSWAHFSL